jgi:hypothetical protein
VFQKLILGFAVAALAVASAETYRVTLFQPTVVQGTELKAGDYRVDVKDAKVVIAAGKQSVEAPVKVENGDQKFGSTSVRYATENGKYAIQEIRLGGTKTKLIFNR